VGVPLLTAVWMLGAPAWGETPCPDLSAALDATERSLTDDDRFRARTSMDEVERAFGCGEVPQSHQIARYWAADGALAWLAGERSAAEDAFLAISDLGGVPHSAVLPADARAAYEALPRALPIDGTLSFEPYLGDHRVWIDGRPAAEPFSVPEGFHLIQVGRARSDVRFGRVLLVIGGGTTVVATGLQPARIGLESESTVALTTGSGPDPITVHATLDLGLAAAFGKAIQAGPIEEPATKLMLPAELGLRIRWGGGWAELGGGAAPLVQGQYAFQTDHGPEGTGARVGGHIAGGATAASWKGGALSAGGLAGLAFPGRLPLAALVRLDQRDLGLGGQLRLGVDLATDGRFEPAVGLLFSAESR
jgi:hypothetical protein